METKNHNILARKRRRYTLVNAYLAHYKLLQTILSPIGLPEISTFDNWHDPGVAFAYQECWQRIVHVLTQPDRSDMFGSLNSGSIGILYSLLDPQPEDVLKLPLKSNGVQSNLWVMAGNVAFQSMSRAQDMFCRLASVEMQQPELFTDYVSSVVQQVPSVGEAPDLSAAELLIRAFY